MKDMDWLEEYKDGTIIKVYIQPGASKSEFAGEYGDPARLKLRVKAPPIEGKANKAVVVFLAKFFEIKKLQVELIRGSQSRNKDFFLDMPLSSTQEIIKVILLDKKHPK